MLEYEDKKDEEILNWLIQEFRQETGIDLSKDRMALQRLRDAANRAKVELSSVHETEINLPFITADASGPAHLVKTLSRSKLEQLVASLLKQTDGPRRNALTDAGVSTEDVEQVIEEEKLESDSAGQISPPPTLGYRISYVLGCIPWIGLLVIFLIVIVGILVFGWDVFGDKCYEGIEPWEDCREYWDKPGSYD